MSESTTTLDELLAHSGWLAGLARRLVGESGAEDLVQEVYLRASERPPAAVRSPRGWLASVLRSVHRRGLERGAARRDRERDVARSEALPSVAEVSERAEAQRLLVDAVLALDERSRHVILLHYFEGLEPIEIARRSGIADSTVRSRLARALVRLRAELDARPGGRGSWFSGLMLLAAPERAAQPVPLFGLGSALMGKLVAVVSVSLVVLAAVLWVEGREVEEPSLELVRQDAELAVPSPEARDFGAAETDAAREELVESSSEKNPGDVALEASFPVTSVSGVVLDPQGRPVADAVVYEGTAREVATSLRRPDDPPRPSARTDDGGRFRLEFEEDDARTGALLSARMDGFAPSVVREVELRRDSDTPGVELRLLQGATLSGLVFGPDEQPVSGRAVLIAAVDHGEHLQVSTDDDGRFEVSALQPGRWQVSTFTEDEELAAAGKQRGISVQSQAEVELVDGEVTEVVLGKAVAGSPRVTGTLMLEGEPTKGLMQWAPLARPKETQLIQVGSDGRYEVDLPTPGRWSVLANVFGGTARGRRVIFDIAEAEERELDIDLRGATLFGRVVDEEGDPVEGAGVQLSVVGDTPRLPVPTLGGMQARTDEDGRYRFGLLKEGTYIVIVAGSQPDDASSHAAQASAPVVLDASEVEVPDIVLREGAAANLFVKDPVGRPAQRASLFFHDAEGRQLNPLTWTRTDTEGRGETPSLPLGPVWITAVHPLGVSPATSVEIGVEEELELQLLAPRWIELAAESETLDPTRHFLSVTDARGAEWCGLLDLGRYFESPPPREHPERPLVGPLPPGSYSVRVEREDGSVWSAEHVLAADSSGVSSVFVRP